MANPWTVNPKETDKIELTWIDGETSRPLWLLVKKYLSIGEERAMLRSVSSVSQPVSKRKGEAAPPATANIAWTDYSFARAVAYIIDWSLAHDPDPENRLPPTRESLETLKQDAFELIDNALDAHQQKMADAKKAPAGSPTPSETSG